MQFSDYFWKDEDPTFLPRSRVHKWLIEFTKNFGIDDCIKLNTQVISVSKNGDKI